MYGSSRRYKKNDWWDLVTVIEQELERSESLDTYYNIVDELKWRIVESISEGGNFKIRNKASELYVLFEKYLANQQEHDDEKVLEIKSIFEFIMTKPREGK